MGTFLPQPRSWRMRLGRLVLAASLALVPLAANPATAADDIREDQAQRAMLGLAADEATIRQIAASGADVGSERWGIVLTADEVADIEARIEYAQAVND